MLDQTRKFGLHLVLAHQRLGQLKDRSEAIYNGIMAGGQTKIVFGGLTDEDAGIMAREVLRNSFNLEQPKHILDKPIVVDEVPFWLESQSETSTWASSRTVGESYGGGNSTGMSGSYGETYDLQRQITGSSGSISASDGASENWGVSSSESASQGGSRTTSRSQTLKPVRVIMPTAVHSLEEATHLAIVKLRELPNRSAIVRRRGKQPVRIHTVDIKPALASEERVARFLERTRTLSPYLSATADADAEIARRASSLGVIDLVPPEGDDGFWTEAS